MIKDNQVVLRNFGCQLDSTSVKGGQLENENFGESEVDRCERGPIAKTSPADKLKSNAPPRGYCFKNQS